MSKRIYISPSDQDANLYATGNTNEMAQCKKIAKACFDFLKKQGFEVKCTYADGMKTRVSESNAFGADIHLAIHTNATAKHNVTGGTQILLYDLGGENKKAGQAVLKRLAPVTPGSSAEKLVAQPEFYEIRAAKALTVYCECEFHDTKEGSDFIINNTAKIGEAIARGICDYYGVTIKEGSAANVGTSAKNDGTLYTVQVGAFKVKKNAESYVEKLKKTGFDAFIVTKKSN